MLFFSIVYLFLVTYSIVITKIPMDTAGRTFEF